MLLRPLRDASVARVLFLACAKRGSPSCSAVHTALAVKGGGKLYHLGGGWRRRPVRVPFAGDQLALQLLAQRPGFCECLLLVSFPSHA